MSDELWISMQDSDTILLEIKDCLGRTLISKKVMNGDSIDVSHLPIGFYYALFIQHDNRHSVKFIKK